MTAIRRARLAALAAIAALVAAASLVSFAESYRGLWLWAHEHGLRGPWAVAWPLQVDVFIAVGEAALFVALADRWPARSRGAAWAVTLAGLAVSVAGNVGHVAGHGSPAGQPPPCRRWRQPPRWRSAWASSSGWSRRSQAPAVPAVPAAVPASLAALNGHAAAAADLFAADLEAGRVPGIRAIRSGLSVGQDKAQPGTGVPAHPRPYPVDPAPGSPWQDAPGAGLQQEEIIMATELPPEGQNAGHTRARAAARGCRTGAGVVEGVIVSAARRRGGTWPRSGCPASGTTSCRRGCAAAPSCAPRSSSWAASSGTGPATTGCARRGTCCRRCSGRWPGWHAHGRECSWPGRG